MSIAPDENPRVSDLLTFGQTTAEYGGTYWQWRYALDHGKVQGIRLIENGPHLLVRSSVEEFVKMQAIEKAHLATDTPSDKDKSNARSARREVA